MTPLLTREKMFSSMPSSRLSIVHLRMYVEQMAQTGSQDNNIDRIIEAMQRVEANLADGADARTRTACCTATSAIRCDNVFVMARIAVDVQP